MQASAIEYRLRLPTIVAIVALGFWSPWIELWGLGRRIPLLEWLALELSRLGLFSFAVAVPVTIVLAAALAGAGAALRIWGTAWLGPETVTHGRMQAGEVLTCGPYRFVRNPLYLGTWFTVAAMAFIMPPSGALLAMGALTVFQLRLIFGEEAFLAGQPGESYAAYLRTVPRLVPRLRGMAKPPSGERKPRWLHALLAELNPICVFLVLGVLSWSFDPRLMVRAILVGFGFSLVVRALRPEDRD
jgi:protein-S-isoprenylcysteine O-methyltransferase Ste14